MARHVTFRRRFRLRNLPMCLAWIGERQRGGTLSCHRPRDDGDRGIVGGLEESMVVVRWPGWWGESLLPERVTPGDPAGRAARDGWRPPGRHRWPCGHAGARRRPTVAARCQRGGRPVPGGPSEMIGDHRADGREWPSPNRPLNGELACCATAGRRSKAIAGTPGRARGTATGTSAGRRWWHSSAEGSSVSWGARRGAIWGGCGVRPPRCSHLGPGWSSSGATDDHAARYSVRRDPRSLAAPRGPGRPGPRWLSRQPRPRTPTGRGRADRARWARSPWRAPARCRTGPR